MMSNSTEPPTQAVTPNSGITRMPTRRKLAFASVALGLFLAMLEIIGRILVPATGGTSRWDYESNHVRLSGFPALNTLLEPDAKRFWRLRAGVAPAQIIGRVGTDDLIFTLSTDSDGFRTTPAIDNAERAVLFLGDSCTLGIGVDDDQTIPAVVQRTLSGTRCINAGVPGYSAYQGRVYLEEIVRDLQPAAVVINFGFNDDAAWDDRSDLEHATDAPVQLSWWLSTGIARLTTRGLESLRPVEQASTSPATSNRPRLTDGEFVGQIESMVATCRTNGATPILLIWPLRVQLSQDGVTPKQLALRQFAAKNGVTVIDLLETIRDRESSDVDFFADLLHFNEVGCQMAARRIAETLRSVMVQGDSPAATTSKSATAP